MIIRNGTPADRFRLVEMATRFILSSPYGTILKVEPELMLALVDTMLENGVVWVAELEPGQVVGMLGIWQATHPFDGRKVADEIAWWVEPEYRNTSAGWRLFTYMEGWCVQNRLHMVKMVAPEGSPVADFYQRMGYQAVETTWIKVLKPNGRIPSRADVRPGGRQEEEPRGPAAADRAGADRPDGREHHAGAARREPGR